ncbi:MAG: Ankyrin-3 [Pleopsidium flavum]|nr:MAG: Ankyrin-3 [Pleopsidium flavum]
MNLRTLDRLGHQLKLAFVDACRVNTIPEHLPALLKSYLGVIRDHGTDAPIIGGEALRWIETQGTEAWREAYECNPKPELVDEIMKVAMEHLRIVSFYDASEDLHPVVEPAPISIAEVSKPIAQPHKSLSRWAQAIPSIQMSKPIPVVEPAPSSHGEGLSQPSQLFQTSKTLTPATFSNVEGLNQPSQLIQVSKTLTSALLSNAEGLNQPSQLIQTSKTPTPASLSNVEGLYQPSQLIQTSNTLTPASFPNVEGLNQPSQLIQVSKTLTSALLSNAEGLKPPTLSIQTSKISKSADELVPTFVSEDSNQTNPLIRESETSKVAIEPGTTSHPIVSKQPTAQLDPLRSPWTHYMLSSKQDERRPTSSFQDSGPSGIHSEKQIGEPSRSASQPSCLIINNITEEDFAIAGFPAHLNQEFAKICPRSLTGSRCSHCDAM